MSDFRFTLAMIVVVGIYQQYDTSLLRKVVVQERYNRQTVEKRLEELEWKYKRLPYREQ